MPSARLTPTPTSSPTCTPTPPSATATSFPTPHTRSHFAAHALLRSFPRYWGDRSIQMTRNSNDVVAGNTSIELSSSTALAT
eukprot:6172984-Pleurochrysis_carterae.AAC.1